jgi:hypothetical protein
MSLAMKRLKNLGWMALVFLVAILLYPLSLNVASLHSDLVVIDNKILKTKQEISFLQAELRTRANMQQMEEWNKLEFGYAPPTAEQFMQGEAALAEHGEQAVPLKPVIVTASVAPAGIVGPRNGIFKSDTVGASSKIGRRAENEDAAVAIKETGKTLDRLSKPVLDNVGMRHSNVAPSITPKTSRTEKLAQIDDKLLSDDLMKDIRRKADQERRH